MSSVGNVSGSSASSSLLQLLGTSTGTSSAQSAHRGHHGAGGFKSRLDDLLSSSGLDDSQIDSLESDLKDAMKSTIDSGTFPPDPAAMKSAMASVFNKYGLDGDSLADSLAPPPPPSASSASAATGPVDATSLLDDNNDALTKLIEQLQQSLASSGTSSDTDHDGKSDKLSELLLSALSGVNGLA